MDAATVGGGAVNRSRLAFAALLLTSCAYLRRMPEVTPPPDPLIGTWRMARYEIWDSNGARQTPLGLEPSGYLVLDETGHAHVQLMRPGMAATFGAYYGTYAADSMKTRLRITVEGSNDPQYLGTVQERPFQLRGDTLVLGVEGEYRATLTRLRPPPVKP